MSDELLTDKVIKFIDKYSIDVSKQLVQKVLQLKTIHDANFGTDSLSPLHLLNKHYKFKLQHLFPNFCIALHIFCTIPVTVAEAERSFSKLKLIKNYLRKTMSQDCLSDLGILSIECQLACTLNFDSIIDYFANLRARKAHLL